MLSPGGDFNEAGLKLLILGRLGIWMLLSYRKLSLPLKQCRLSCIGHRYSEATLHKIFDRLLLRGPNLEHHEHGDETDETDESSVNCSTE